MSNQDFAICPDIKGTLRLRDRLKTGVQLRSTICQEILSQEPWDLFITVKIS
ncbi:MAG: hypothetical protein ACLFV6_01140 [Spirulinaceae cyanobacterium]